MNKLGVSKDTGHYSYSYALYPENYQPSGTVNMSRVNKINYIDLITSNPNRNGLEREIRSEVSKVLSFFPEDIDKFLQTYLHIPEYKYKSGSEDPEIVGTRRERAKKLHKALSWIPVELVNMLIEYDGSPTYTLSTLSKLYTTALNLNVLRIMSGKAGVSYSN